MLSRRIWNGFFYSLSAKAPGINQLSARIAWSPLIPTQINHPGPVYKGRVAVLIDEATNSAADNLVACLRDLLPGVIFVGQPSAGSSGAPRPVRLNHSGATVRFCTMRVYSPKGELIEGRGVIPSIRVPPSRRDIVEGRDAVLQAAVAALSK